MFDSHWYNCVPYVGGAWCFCSESIILLSLSVHLPTLVATSLKSMQGNHEIVVCSLTWILRHSGNGVSLDSILFFSSVLFFFFLSSRFSTLP